MKYDYLVVGSGLYGAVFAREAADRGKKVLVIDKRPNVAGNIYTETVEGIHVHKYGAHIFHTNDTKVWKYITRFAEFNRFTNSPVANYHGELYSLPFNMYTFNKMWGVVTPEEAAAKIEEQRQAAGITEPKNLEEQAISLVGKDIFEKLVKGYTEKQWGRDWLAVAAADVRTWRRPAVRIPQAFPQRSRKRPKYWRVSSHNGTRESEIPFRLYTVVCWLCHWYRQCMEVPVHGRPGRRWRICIVLSDLPGAPWSADYDHGVRCGKSK